MPTDPSGLGFANRWYPEAVQTSTRVRLTDSVRVRLDSAPVFIATTLEALTTRGKLDLFSHDLDDLLNVIDGRASIIEDMRGASAELQAAVGEQFVRLLQQSDFDNTLPGLLSDERRTHIVLARLGNMNTSC